MVTDEIVRLRDRAFAAEAILRALSDEYNLDDACDGVKINGLIEQGEECLRMSHAFDDAPGKDE